MQIFTAMLMMNSRHMIHVGGSVKGGRSFPKRRKGEAMLKLLWLTVASSCVLSQDVSRLLLVEVTHGHGRVSSIRKAWTIFLI